MNAYDFQVVFSTENESPKSRKPRQCGSVSQGFPRVGGRRRYRYVPLHPPFCRVPK